MYRVEYYCPSSGVYTWQTWNETFFLLNSAIRRANRLIFQFGSVRVLDSSGNVLYQV
jgi:hypothetical protein